ncbi:MAG TPA: hypothetical protein VF597_00280 [Candidatus Saccharimonadales bacterium]|jgi:transcriptional regulator NrdR family protein
MNGSFVVKHGRHDSEAFDPLKLHSSLAAACLSTRAYEGAADLTAQRVCRHVIDWLMGRTEVTTADIRRVAAEHLARYDEDAAYLYEQHGVMV